MGTVYIVATPIGNIEDITIRAIKTLLTVDLILCEDTRHTGIFISEITKRYSEHFNFKSDWKPLLLSYYDEVEKKKLPEIIALLEQGKHLALVSDAGTPLISDPGYLLVQECYKRNIPVISIPGSSAVLAALTSSGLPADKFTFFGYPPEKQHARLTVFKNIPSKCTIIFYCAPHKLAGTLTDLQMIFGNMEIVLARELTKIHEEIWKGTITEALKHFSDPKGEFVVLFHTD